ncbi:MAG: S49 family peptidase [Chlamydiales bacterium]|nr:S49 family peptidase [Chlamydiales bacterium]
MNLEPKSIFIHSLRTFFVALFGVIGAFIGLGLVLLLFVGVFSGSDEKGLPSKAKILPNAEWSRKDLGASAPILLQIPIEGTIGMDQVTAEKIQEVLLDSREDALKNGRVKGIMLVINSPGGGANESNVIYRLLKEYKERYQVPIYAYVNGLCASGGYYIACAADQIYSSKVSLIGSVGVLGWPPYINVSESLEKIGVNTKTIYAGKGKDEMNPFRPWKPDEGASRQDLVNFYYDNFVEVVTENRPHVTQEKLVGVYGAGVFPAYEAEEHGFIDNSNMELSQAIGALAKAAGVEEKYQVIQFKTKSWLKQMFKQQSKSPLLTGKISHELALPERTAIDYLYVP